MARAKADAGDDKKPNQTEMVKAALQELGAGAKPRAIQEYVKSTFNKELSTSLISNYKSVMKKKSGDGRRRGRPVAAGSGAGGIRVDDLETVRGLVRRLGADNVRRLVEVFA